MNLLEEILTSFPTPAPAVGDDVHYTEPRTNWCQAAIVTAVAPGTVHLVVFPPPGDTFHDGPTYNAFGVVWGNAPAGRPAWHWPERTHDR